MADAAKYLSKTHNHEYPSTQEWTQARAASTPILEVAAKAVADLEAELPNHPYEPALAIQYLASRQQLAMVRVLESSTEGYAAGSATAELEVVTIGKILECYRTGQWETVYRDIREDVEDLLDLTEEMDPDGPVWLRGLAENTVKSYLIEYVVYYFGIYIDPTIMWGVFPPRVVQRIKDRAGSVMRLAHLEVHWMNQASREYTGITKGRVKGLPSELWGSIADCLSVGNSYPLDYVSYRDMIRCFWSKTNEERVNHRYLYLWLADHAERELDEENHDVVRINRLVQRIAMWRWLSQGRYPRPK